MLWFFALTTFIFGSIAVYFSWRHEKGVEESAKKQKELDRKIYELNLVQGITEKIGYSLSIESVAQTIAVTIENLFDTSTVSYAITADKKINIKTYLKENVSANFTRSVSKIMQEALAAIDPIFSSYQITESQATAAPKSAITEYFDTVPQSYFNVPLVMSNQLVGMINISSRKKGIYQDADMSLLYKIVNTAQVAISRLNDVIETEKGKLDSLILSLPAGTVMLIAEQGQFQLSVINQAAKEFLKLSENPSLTDFLSSVPKDLNLPTHIKDVFETKKTLRFADIKIYDKYFTVHVNPVLFANTGKIIGVSIVLRDMSLEKKIESIRADFTNMIVHELRAPASAIKGASSLLKSHDLPKDDKEKMMEVISDSAAGMMDTINELLDVAQMEQGRINIKLAKNDLAKIILEHIEVFSYAAKGKNINIGFSSEGKIGEFLFDNGRIGEVINNLISNALKFTNYGGKIEIKILLQPSVSAEGHQDRHVEVLVSDNGTGIPDDKKSILFTKFGQIDGGTGAVEQKQGSSGLGLYICRQIVEAHGGKIWLESRVGEGTKVYFTLPFKTEEKSEVSFPQKLAN